MDVDDCVSSLVDEETYSNLCVPPEWIQGKMISAMHGDNQSDVVPIRVFKLFSFFSWRDFCFSADIVCSGFA